MTLSDAYIEWFFIIFNKKFLDYFLNHSCQGIWFGFKGNNYVASFW